MGDAARVEILIKDYAPEYPLIFFGSGLFNPSIMSLIFKGRQMADVMNYSGLNYAMF